MDSSSDPIPASSKIVDVALLVQNEKRVGLKNVHVVSAGTSTMSTSMLQFFSNRGTADVIRVLPGNLGGWDIGFIWPRSLTGSALRDLGWVSRAPRSGLLTTLRQKYGDQLSGLDTSRIHALSDAARGARLEQVRIPRTGLKALLVLTSPTRRRPEGSITVIQEEGGRVVGGNTFVLRMPV